jgi:hypothetical protein
MLSLFMIDFHNGMNCIGVSACHLMAYKGSVSDGVKNILPQS